MGIYCQRAVAVITKGCAHFVGASAEKLRATKERSHLPCRGITRSPHRARRLQCSAMGPPRLHALARFVTSVAHLLPTPIEVTWGRLCLAR